jgi:hypothetical protein
MKVRTIGAAMLVATFGAGAVFAGPLDKPADEKLTGEAIKATWFNGQPFTATAPDGSVYKFIFQPDGKASKVPTAKKAPAVAGFWRIIAEGYCVRWTGQVREKCFNIRNEGTATVARFGKVIVANWTR